MEYLVNKKAFPELLRTIILVVDENIRLTVMLKKRNLYEMAQRRIASRLAGRLSKLTDAELKTFATVDFE